MMDRPELEDRIRETLSAHADDVEPSPQLYRRVRRDAARRTWWRRGLVGVATATAAIIVVVAGMNLLRPPTTVVIEPEPAGSPPTQQETTAPEAADTVEPTTSPGTEQVPAPTPTPDTPTDGDPIIGSDHELVGVARTTVVATDEERVLQLDPVTGETIAELPAFHDFAEGAWVGDVAVRPGSGDTITVASVIGLEGQSWEVEVSTFRDGERTGRYRAPVPAGPMNDETERHPPTVAWSEDGLHLAWMVIDGDGGSTATVLDWTAAQVRPEDPGVVRSVRKWMFEDGASLRVQDWTGDPAMSRLWLTHVGGGPLEVLELASCDAPDCAPFEASRETGVARDAASFPDEAVVDIAQPAGDTALALVPTGAQPGDRFETILLMYEPNLGPPWMTMLLPDELGRGAVIDPWLAADGDLVAVGDAGEPLVDDSRAWLARTITHDPAETNEHLRELDQDSAVRLPDTITAVDIFAP